MVGSAIVSGNGVMLIEIPDGGLTGEVLTKLSNEDFDFDWAAGGGGGGQVDSVVGGVNITVNAADPVNPIVDLDAAITGVSVNGVTLDVTGVASNFLDETGAYSEPPNSGGLLSSEYRFSTSIVKADPGSGRFRYDNAVHASVTEIFIDDINNDGVDISTLLGLIAIGDRLYIQQSDDASKFAVWNVDGPAPVDEGGWWTISVQLVSDGDVLDNNARCIIVLQIGGDMDLTYLRLDTSNDPLTGELVTQAVRPLTAQQRELGTDAERWIRVSGRLGVFVGESNNTGGVTSPQGAIRTFAGTASTGIMAGNQVRLDTGVTELSLAGGSYKAVAVMGNVFSYSTGAARILNVGGGSVCMGSAFSYGAGNALINATGPATFTCAYSYTGYGATANNHTLLNSGIGSFLSGYSYGYGTVTVTSSGQGSFVQGFFNANLANNFTVMRATGAGAFAQGAIANGLSGATGTIESTGTGSFAQGHVVSGGTISASQPGAFAQGRANNKDILASGQGSFAHGRAQASGDIIASGIGAFAIGDANSGDIIASGDNSCQFGPGTNSLDDTFQIGDAGIRFKGTTGVPGVLQNGDFWMDTTLRLRSDGISWNFDQSAAFTRNAAIVEDRTLLASASATTLNNNNVLAALIADLQTIGALG